MYINTKQFFFFYKKKIFYVDFNPTKRYVLCFSQMKRLDYTFKLLHTKEVNTTGQQGMTEQF